MKKLTNINQVTQQKKPLNQLKKYTANVLTASDTTINEEKIKVITRQYSNSSIKILEKYLPKETLNALDAFSVLNVEKFLTDVHSQEFAVYENDQIKLLVITFKLALKG